MKMIRALLASVVAGISALGCASTPGPGMTTEAATQSRRLQGIYSYLADAGMFADCRTGSRLPVAQEGDNAALEAAYARNRPAPGAALLATVDARVDLRPSMEGSQPPRPSLVVDRFVGVSPGQDCSVPIVDASLENTYWRLDRLHDTPVKVPGWSRESHLILQPRRRSIAGWSGCNWMAGDYALNGERLWFGHIA